MLEQSLAVQEFSASVILLLFTDDQKDMIQPLEIRAKQHYKQFVLNIKLLIFQNP